MRRMFQLLSACLLLEGVGADGSGGGGGAPVPVPPVESGGGGDDGGEIRMTTEQLNARLARDRRATLKRLHGTDDEEAIRTQLAADKELRTKAEERRLAEMSEIERTKAEKLAADARAAELQEQLDEQRLAGHIASACAGLGIKNLEYARFLVDKKAEALPQGQELDVATYLKEQQAKPQHAAAFGLAAEEKPVPVNTSPAGGGNPPPPPPPAGGPAGGKDVRAMSKAEFANHLAGIGVGTAGT